jgi:hypothetical protein
VGAGSGQPWVVLSDLCFAVLRLFVDARGATVLSVRSPAPRPTVPVRVQQNITSLPTPPPPTHRSPVPTRDEHLKLGGFMATQGSFWFCRSRFKDDPELQRPAMITAHRAVIGRRFQEQE